MRPFELVVDPWEGFEDDDSHDAQDIPDSLPDREDRESDGEITGPGADRPSGV